MNDPYILERRLRQLHRLPWPIPAVVLIRMGDRHFDELDIAERAGRGAYWMTLARIIRELTEQGSKA
jgi:hypothetical protein